MGWFPLGQAPASLGHNGGLGGLNLYFQEAYTENTFIDRFKQTNGFAPASSTDQNWPSRLDENGLPQSMPSTGNWGLSEGYVYGPNGTDWVFDWTGGGAASVAVTPQSGSWSGGGTFPLQSGSDAAKRKIYRITGSPVGSIAPATVGGPLKITLAITGMTAPLTSFRFYRLSDEPYLANSDATAIYTQEHLARMKCGALRTMDANVCNNSKLARWEDRRGLNHVNWISKMLRGSWWHTTSAVSKNTHTVSSLGTLEHGQPIAFWLPSRPTFLAVAAVTLGNPTTLKCYNHGLSTNDRAVTPAGLDGGGGGVTGNWFNAFSNKVTATGIPPDFAVTVLDADTLTVPVDSTGFTAVDVRVALSMTSALVTGTFAVAEVVTGGTSGATGTITASATSGADRVVTVNTTVGRFVTGETLTGGTSGAVGTLTNTAGQFTPMPNLQLTDGVTTKRILRPSLFNSAKTEFSAFASGDVAVATYDATFDVLLFAGDNNNNFSAGVPVEAQISLANYLRCHLFLTFPIYTTASFWTSLSTLTKATLNHGLQFWPEIGNEIWQASAAFSSTWYATSLGARNDSMSPGNPSVTARDIGYAAKFTEMANAVIAVYGDTSDDYKIVLGCQQGSLSDERLKGNARIQALVPSATYPSKVYPADLADYIAVAPYTSLKWQTSSPNPNTYPGLLDMIDNYKSGGSARQTAFDWLRDEITWPSTPGYVAPSTLNQQLGRDNTEGRRANIQAQIATVVSKGYTGRNAFGLRQLCYEGSILQTSGNMRNDGSIIAITGTAPTSGNAIVAGDYQAYWLAFLESTQAAQAVTNYLTGIAAAGAEYPNVYCIAAPWSDATNFGLQRMNDFGAATTPMLTAFQAWDGAA